jgi:hypothetical protein
MQDGNDNHRNLTHYHRRAKPGDTVVITDDSVRVQERQEHSS